MQPLLLDLTLPDITHGAEHTNSCPLVHATEEQESSKQNPETVDSKAQRARKRICSCFLDEISLDHCSQLTQDKEAWKSKKSLKDEEEGGLPLKG